MKNKINYRPEIDGLRCLAVVSVILYHYDFSFNGMKFLQEDTWCRYILCNFRLLNYINYIKRIKKMIFHFYIFTREE